MPDRLSATDYIPAPIPLFNSKVSRPRCTEISKKDANLHYENYKSGHVPSKGLVPVARTCSHGSSLRGALACLSLSTLMLRLLMDHMETDETCIPRMSTSHSQKAAVGRNK